MYKFLYQIFALLLFTVLSLSGCGGKSETESSRPTEVDSVTRPDSEIFNGRIYLYDKGRVTTELFSERIRKFEAIDSTMGYKLDVDVFDTVGVASSHIVGDSGVIREDSNQLKIFGNVVVITRDSTILETDYLTWNPATNKIQTDAFVRFIRGGDTITGWGFEANHTMTRFRILNQVSGTISEPDEL
jgi:LPS export ABC transporter protein LptC